MIDVKTPFESYMVGTEKGIVHIPKGSLGIHTGVCHQTFDNMQVYNSYEIYWFCLQEKILILESSLKKRIKNKNVKEQ